MMALGKEFDGRIEGINLAESFVTFGDTLRLYPKGFTPETYRDAVVSYLKAYLKADYIFWCTEEPFYSGDLVRFMRSLKRRLH